MRLAKTRNGEKYEPKIDLLDNKERGYNNANSRNVY